MENIIINVENSRKHRGEQKNILNTFFEKIIFFNKEDLLLCFTPISKKMNTFLKKASVDSNQRCGIFSIENLEFAVEEFIYGNINSFYITNKNKEFTFDFILDRNNNIYMNYCGEYEVILDTIKDISNINIDNQIFFEFNIPYSFGLISYENDSATYFLKNEYPDLINLKHRELIGKYESYDYLFDIDSSRSQDLDTFLNEIGEEDEIYTIYESINFDSNYKYIKTYYDYGQAVNSEYGIVESFNSKKELKDILTQCQNGRIYLVKIFLEKSKTLFCFDKEGYWKINLAKPLR